MPNISIKDVPDAWAQALRERAARNHRSLQGELMAIIELAVQGQPATAQTNDTLGAASRRETVVGFDRFGHAITRQGWKTVEQVVAELKAQFPEPILGQMSSIDIIRQDRDSR